MINNRGRNDSMFLIRSSKTGKRPPGEVASNVSGFVRIRSSVDSNESMTSVNFAENGSYLSPPYI